jgi:hypothetical protein
MTHAAPAAGEVVRVGAVDPELLGGLDPAVARRLARTLVTELVHLERGARVDVGIQAAGGFGMLLLDGVVARSVQLGTRSSIELLGAGDIVRPWQDEHAIGSLPGAVAWVVMEPARLALLDADFVASAARHPAIFDELAGRLVQRSHALADRLAIAQIPRLEARMLALLWHLADRWGRRSPSRVSISLRLGHGTLANLACAQRPSVSVALRNLCAAGRIARRPEGGWDLFGAPASESELLDLRRPRSALSRLAGADAPLAGRLTAAAAQV